VRLRRDFWQVGEKCSRMLRRGLACTDFLSDPKIIPLILNLSKNSKYVFNKLQSWLTTAKISPNLP
jgi:hypothetical protein